MATYSATQGFSTIQISPTAAGFTQNSNPCKYYLNNANAGSSTDSFIITFADGASIRLTDFLGRANSSSGANVLGIPGSTQLGFNLSINIIGGSGWGDTFDIFDNNTGVKLLDNYKPANSYGFTNPYAEPYAVIGYSSGQLTIQAPKHSSGGRVFGVTVTSSGTGSFPVSPTSYVGGAGGTKTSDQYISGATDGSPWVFFLAAPDTTAPTLSSSSPTDDATDIAIGSNLVLTFSESISAGTGSVVLKKSDGTIIATIPVTDAQVAISGSTVTINPTTDLDYSTSYYLEIAGGVFKDAANNPYAGISNPTTLNFTTVSLLTANTPAFSTPTATADGFTVQISNYDPNFTYGGSTSANGTVAISNTGLVTVTGVAANTASTTTITTTRTGYTSGSSQNTVTSLNFGAASQATLSTNCGGGDKRFSIHHPTCHHHQRCLW
jgi:methionine-rich copper-binding protein CopC